MHVRLLLLGLLLPASTFAQARVVVQPPAIRVEIAPPVPIVEAPPPPPSPQHVWTGGHWAFRDGRYGWVPGTYVVAPEPAARWVPARWVAREGGWYFEPGRWATVASPWPPPQPPPPPQAPPPPGYAPAPGYPPPPPPGPVRPPARAVLSAKEIHADVVRARVIYATEVHARDGRVGVVVKLHGKPPKLKGAPEIEQREVMADTIYAKEIQANWIEADEIHAKQVKIGRREREDDDD